MITTWRIFWIPSEVLSGDDPPADARASSRNLGASTDARRSPNRSPATRKPQAVRFKAL
jgi:hypothetical protein